MPRMNRRSNPDRQQLLRLTGARVRQAREEMRLTQHELAAALGFTGNTTVSDIERARNGMDIHDLQRLANMSGHPMEFFTRVDYQAPPQHHPRTKADWDAMYLDDPDRAAAHHALDQMGRRNHDVPATV